MCVCDGFGFELLGCVLLLAFWVYVNCVVCNSFSFLVCFILLLWGAFKWSASLVV